MSSKLFIIIFTSLLLVSQSQKFLGISDEEASILILSGDYKETPYKLSHKDCIKEVPSNSIVEEIDITETEKEVHITLVTGNKIKLTACPHPSYSRMTLQSSASAPQKLTSNDSNHWPNHTWFGVQQNFSSKITSFTANYIVPNAPANDENTTLFYWLGLFTDVLSIQKGLVIQPVLGYTAGEFSFTSWNCCPAGYVFHSEQLSGMKTGDVLYGAMNLVDEPKTYEIISKYGNQSSNLKANLTKFDDFKGNWGVVVGEYYNILGCDQYPVGPVTFENITVTTVDEQSPALMWTNFDQWDMYINCGGSTQVSWPGQKVSLIYTEATA